MYDLAVLGGGSGGLTVATAAARVGAKVVLIEKDRIGGECTYSACVPSKALLKAAREAHHARQAHRFGIHVGEVRVDFPAVMRRVHETVDGFAKADAADRLRSKGMDVVLGTPCFESYDTIVVDGMTRINAHRFVIATGSRPSVPEIPGLAEVGYLDNRTVWSLAELPESLIILGAGAVGLEMGLAFTRLGTKVTVLDSNEEILHREDAEAAKVLREHLAAEGISFYNTVEVTGVGRKEGKILVKFRSKHDGATFEALRSHLLIAAGRTPNVDGLNLEAAGIHADPKRGIHVDDYLQTESRHVYAIGDVNGRDLYTHAADREGSIVFQNAVLKLSKKYRSDSIPRTLFTDPEFAAVGATEAEARQADPEARVFTLDLGSLDRVRIDGDSGGFAKVIASASGKVLGAVIVGPEASLVIEEFTLAIEHGLTLEDIANTVHPYPTVAGLARALGNQFSKTRLEKGYVKTALRWFYGFEPEKAGADH